ncbi:MAG: hypothetical protein GX458_06190 [Phyllobacteriaceae bacterium]|nr:hypothetical protein [Phyllobacteriaceae bacterium]
MDEFSGNRAKTRPNRDVPRRTALLRLAAPILLWFAAAPIRSRAAEHAAAPTPTAPPPQEPAATTVPPPSAERPAPPVLDGPIAAPAPLPRHVWLADATTGRALGGYDPVGYFLNGRPTLGDPDRQSFWQGVTWLFQDEGTQAAFRDAPEVYAPLFDGHCAFAVSQGRPAEGSPQHFLVFRGRLLLFADATARTAFLLDPDRLLGEANRRWPTLLATLP